MLGESGDWRTSHRLSIGRWGHSSWGHSTGVLLVGGHHSPRTTELALNDGSTEQKFNLQADSM